MARPPHRLTIPAALNCLHSDTYAINQFGQQSHAGLGRECGRNDRKLYADLRRSQCEAFPEGTGATLLTTAYLHGQRFGPWQVYGTPGVRSLSLYLRVFGEVNATGTVVPYTDTEPYRGMNEGTGDFTFGPLAAANSVIGPITVALRPGPQLVGFVVHMGDKGITGPTGPVVDVDHMFIQAADGAFAALPAAPTRRTIRLVDNAAPVNEVLGWRDTLGVWDSGWQHVGDGAPRADDRIDVWPRIAQPNLQIHRGLTWELRETFFMHVRSISLIEDRLTGRLPDAWSQGE